MSSENFNESVCINSDIPLNYIKNFFKTHINVDKFTSSGGKNNARILINIDKDILIVLTNKLQAALWESLYFNVQVYVERKHLCVNIVSKKEEKIAEINHLLKSVDSINNNVHSKLTEIHLLKTKHNIVDEKIKSINKKKKIKL